MALKSLQPARARQIAGALAILVAVAAVIIDWTTWIELNVAIIYVLPLVVVAAARSHALLWGLAAVLTCVTFVVYLRQVPDGSFSFHDPYFIDRALATGNMLLTAGLLHALIAAFDALDLRGRQAEEASRRKTRLLASVSHDLRTPLTTINLIADLIHGAAGRPKLEGKLTGLAEDLQKSALSLSDIVENAFDLSQLDSGRSVVQESTFSLDTLLAEECRALQPLAAGKSIHLKLTERDGAIWLRADRVKLARVVRNLLNNAIKFTDVGGVTVDACLAPDGSARISVADSGIGIDPANLQLVFDEFARIEPHDADRGGWGLGLAICKRLIGLMGGSVSVESKGQGGSVFIVVLPASRVMNQPVRVA